MIINANALHIPLADKCIHTIVTSPPYYGLRDYGTAKWQGGDPECDHKQYLGGHNPEVSPKQLSSQGTQQYNYRNKCGKCGAVRIDAQIGLELTPDAYIANLVAVFRECKRILRDDGTLWVNIGDSFNSNGTGDVTNVGGFQGKQIRNNSGYAQAQKASESKKSLKCLGMKPKDLMGIPWMLAFALRADGWYLRSDIIWAKKNCMPESVKDRPTKSHEYIFLLSKSSKYYYDNEAVKEPAVTANTNGIMPPIGGVKHTDSGENPTYSGNRPAWAYKNLQPDGQQPNTMHLNRLEGDEYLSPVRNKRDVWFVSTKPYKGAHYATFNPELITPCILAGAPEGGIVFDPFVGSGTTVATAIQLGRRGIGLDLSMKYLLENAKARIEDVRLPLLEGAWK